MEVRRRKRWRWAVRIAVSLLLVLVASWIVLDLLAGAKLRREVATYREQGLPLRPHEIEKPKVSPEEDAALIYEKALKLLEARDVAAKVRELQNMGVFDMESWDEVKESIPSILEDPDFKILLEYAGRAASLPSSSFSPAESWDGLMHLSSLQWVAAVQAADNADPEAAVGYVDLILRMGRQVGEVEIFLTTLIRHYMNSQALWVIEESLSLENVDTQQLRDWRNILDNGPLHEWLPASFHTEIAFMWDVFDDLINRPFQESEHEAEWAASFSDRFWMARGGWRSFWARPILKLDLAEFLRISREWAELGRRPYAETGEIWRTNDFPAIPRYAIMTRSSFSPGKVISSIVSGEARATVARTAIALELFRREHGDLPETLAELVPDFSPAVPVDPFTGKPLQYERDENMYHVFTDTPDERLSGGESTVVRESWTERIKDTPR